MTRAIEEHLVTGLLALACLATLLWSSARLLGMGGAALFGESPLALLPGASGQSAEELDDRGPPDAPGLPAGRGRTQEALLPGDPLAHPARLGETGLASVAASPAAEETALVRATLAWPRDPETHFRLGRFLLLGGRPREGLPHLQRSLALGTERLEDVLDLCLPLAGGRLGPLRTFFPTQGEAAERLAGLLLDRGLSEESAAVFGELMARQAGDEELRRRYADHLFRAGRFAEAEGEFGRLAAVDPRNAELPYRLACSRGERGETAGALEAIDRALRLKPGHAGALYYKAHLLRRLGRREECMEICRALLAADPGLHKGYLLLAACHRERGEAWEAVRLFRQAQRRTGERALFSRLLGDLFREADRLTEAEVEYRECLAQDPAAEEKGRALFGLGLCFQRRGETAEARRLLVLARETGEEEEIASALAHLEGGADPTPARTAAGGPGE